MKPDSARLIVLNIRTGQRIRHAQLQGPIYDMALSTNSDKIAIAAGSEGPLIYDVSSLALDSSLGQDEVHAVRFSSDGFFLASGSGVKPFVTRLYDAYYNLLTTGTEVHSNSIRTLDFTPNCKLIVTGSKDSLAVVQAVPTLSVLHKLTDHSASIRSVLCISDTVFVSGSHDKSIRVWNLKSGKSIKCLTEHKERVNCLIMTTDKSKLVSGGHDHELKIIDAKSFTVIDSYNLGASITCLTQITAKEVFAALVNTDSVVVDINNGRVLRKCAHLHDARGAAGFSYSKPVD